MASVELGLKGVPCTRLDSNWRGLWSYVRPIHLTMPCWWGLRRPKQLSMVATTGVIGCAHVWGPGQTVGCVLWLPFTLCVFVSIHLSMEQVPSLRCSRTCLEIRGIVRLCNGSQKLVLTSRMDTRICVSNFDWLVSYAPCDWSYSCKIYHAMLKINIVCACISKDWKWLVRLFINCIYAFASSKREPGRFLSKAWKQFDVFTETESLEIYLQSIELKQCKNGVE